MENTMTRYMIYFEPVELDADNIEDAMKKYQYGEGTPFILKVVPAEFVFDVDQEKNVESK